MAASYISTRCDDFGDAWRSSLMHGSGELEEGTAVGMLPPSRTSIAASFCSLWPGPSNVIDDFVVKNLVLFQTVV